MPPATRTWLSPSSLVTCEGTDISSGPGAPHQGSGDTDLSFCHLLPDTATSLTLPRAQGHLPCHRFFLLSSLGVHGKSGHQGELGIPSAVRAAPGCSELQPGAWNIPPQPMPLEGQLQEVAEPRAGDGDHLTLTGWVTASPHSKHYSHQPSRYLQASLSIFCWVFSLAGVFVRIYCSVSAGLCREHALK